MNELKPHEAFQKTSWSAVFFCGVAAKFENRDMSGASEKAFPGIFGDFFGCSTPSKKRFF